MRRTFVLFLHSFVILLLYVLSLRSQLKSTVLMLASENGHSNIVQLLVDAGADVNAKDSVRRSL